MIEIWKIQDVMKHLNGLKLIVFDMDDILYGEKDYVKSGYRAVAELIPQVENAEEKLWNAFENKRSAIDHVLLSEGIFTEDLKSRCLHAYRYNIPDIQMYDGVEEMLTDIRSRGIFIGLITDGRPEGQRAKFNALGLSKYIDYTIITDELGGIEYRKPNETAYVMMKQHFNVEYCEMCYVGDNIKKDFIAPQKLGMKSIWFRNKGGIYV